MTARARLRRAVAQVRRLPTTPRRQSAGQQLLAALDDVCPEPFFVEIGANDGQQHDHVRPYVAARGWRGVMVEPVPYVFARLERNFRAFGGVALENVAIADRDGALPFHMLREPTDEERPGLPDWYDGIGSFSRETVLAHRRDIPDIDDRIVTVDVPCLTYDSLLRRHGCPRVDLLVVDAEGYDAELLGAIELERHRPRVVVYEHFHLRHDARTATRERLRGAGYATLEEGFDTWCVLTDREDALTRASRTVAPALPGLSVFDREA